MSVQVLFFFVYATESFGRAYDRLRHVSTHEGATLSTTARILRNKIKKQFSKLRCSVKHLSRFGKQLCVCVCVCVYVQAGRVRVYACVTYMFCAKRCVCVWMYVCVPVLKHQGREKHHDRHFFRDAVVNKYVPNEYVSTLHT